MFTRIITVTTVAASALALAIIAAPTAAADPGPQCYPDTVYKGNSAGGTGSDTGGDSAGYRGQPAGGTGTDTGPVGNGYCGQSAGAIG